MSRHIVWVWIKKSRKFILQTNDMCTMITWERREWACAVVVTTFTSEHMQSTDEGLSTYKTLMKDSDTQKRVKRGVLQFLLDFYLKVLQRLVMYSLNVCVYMLNKVIIINDAGKKSLKNGKSPEQSSQKVNNSNCSKNWVRMYFIDVDWKWPKYVKKRPLVAFWLLTVWLKWQK